MYVLESCINYREVAIEALTEVSIGQPPRRERILIPGADAFYSAEGNTVDALLQVSTGPACSETLACR